ncbi:NHL repeat containing protein [Oopsacas minuta]|uniref:NHL repeat containing protein n=1 Tax=Oopsacas minuta TaxID=111878 RepID=A0AAV7JAZ6_9METZ|nr:NHL repeat containing protein [Oopsacas minuta]
MASVEEVDTLFSQIDNLRVEIRDKIARAHQVLHQREADLLSELQELENYYRGKSVSEQITQLCISKENLIATLKGNESQETLQQMLPPLEARKKILDSKLMTIKNGIRIVKFEWDLTLEAKLRKTGKIIVREIPDYKAKGIPLRESGKCIEKFSTRGGEFNSPESCAIHPQSNNIYVCDFGNNRVQVFSESLNYLFDFENKMVNPADICILGERVYITQSSVNILSVYSIEGRYILSVGRKGNGQLEFDWPTGLAVSSEKNIIYVCDVRNNRFQCLNMDFSFNSYILNVIAPLDIKLTPQSVITLKRGSPSISFYNYSHELIREIVTLGENNQLMKPLYFSLDVENNILIADVKTECVMVISNTGEMLHRFGNVKDGKRHFINPYAVAIDSKNRLIVLSHNPNQFIIAL